MVDLEIIGAHIVTPADTFEGCISIENGQIIALSKTPIGHARRTIDATGLHALPGMIDQHVHFMDPGEPDREDFIHGSSAAATGGVTTVIEHTHGRPVRNVSEFLSKRAYLANRSVVDFGLGAHLWPGYFGEIQGLWEHGISFFKAFTCTTHGVPGVSNGQLLQALTEIAKFDGVVLAHCEDDTVTADNEEHLKYLHRTDGHVVQEWRSREAEELAVANVALIARLTGARLTIAHVSHPLIIEIVRQARAMGADIWTEVCPQYMFLDEHKIESRGAFGKFTPPARTELEAQTLMHLLAAEQIDILSTDHAPSTKAQKMEGDIWTAHFGLPGVETTLPLMLTAVHQHRITLQRIVQVYSESPARRLGLYPRKGSLRIGADADIVLVDLDHQWTIKDDEIISKSGWSPYAGMVCTGKPVMTFVRGNLVMADGKIMASPGSGEYVNRV